MVWVRGQSLTAQLARTVLIRWVLLQLCEGCAAEIRDKHGLKEDFVAQYTCAAGPLGKFPVGDDHKCLREVPTNGRSLHTR